MRIDRFCAAYPVEGVITPRTCLLAFYPREDFDVDGLKDVPPATINALLRVAKQAWRSKHSGMKHPPAPPEFTALYAGDMARPVWIKK